MSREPGLYEGVVEAEYHSGPELSSTGAKTLATETPADYAWMRDNQPINKPAFNLGTAVHTSVLGAGPEWVVVQKKARTGELVDADTWDTVSAQRHADEILAEGKTPILRKDIALVEKMTAAVRSHRLASALFDGSKGKPEVSAYWTHQGVSCRARFDFLREPDATGRLIVPDLKTTGTSAMPHEFARSAANFNYPVQAAFYEDALLSLGYAREVEFLFCVVEVKAPHKVSVVGLTGDDLKRGRALMDRAVRLYRECTKASNWPGIPEEVYYPELPVWWQRHIEEITA